MKMCTHFLIQLLLFGAVFVGAVISLGATTDNASCPSGQCPPPVAPPNQVSTDGKTTPAPSRPRVVSSHYGNKLSQAETPRPATATISARQQPVTPPPQSTAAVVPIPPLRTPIAVPAGQANVNAKAGLNSAGESAQKLPIAEYAEQSPSVNGDFPVGSVAKVLPERTMQVQLSSSDINRIVCPDEITDVNFSKEKGLMVKLQDKNAYLKFLVVKRDDRELYSTTPTEVFIACGGNIYNIIAIPRRIPSQTVQLVPGENPKKNSALYTNDVPFEKKIIGLIKTVYRGNIPDNITEKKMDVPFRVFRDLNLVLNRLYIVEQENLRIKEYRATLFATAKEPAIYLKEKDFLKNELATKPVAVSIDVLHLKKGQTSRIFVVERTGGQS